MELLSPAEGRPRTLRATKAGVLPAAGEPIEICEVSIDLPRAHEVRVVASGLCPSDYHLITGDLPFGGPRVLGHEVAGVVEAVGPAAIEVIDRPDTILQAVRMLRPGGLATIVGVASGGAPARPCYATNGVSRGSSPFTRDISTSGAHILMAGSIPTCRYRSGSRSRTSPSAPPACRPAALRAM